MALGRTSGVRKGIVQRHTRRRLSDKGFALSFSLYPSL